MDENRLRVFFIIDDKQALMDDLIFFLMFVCHQPYSEILKMPLSVSVALFTTSSRWMEALTGKGKTDHNPNVIIPTLNVEEIMKNAGRHPI